ncbi:MAG: ferredoxin family protein [Kiritimatiellae bacterium]|nr:ferredoxin family protein [Kiritimatiellia bacterium]MDD5520950.1 ferredoxin family protein [Kiritimatiellia bacterium]
MKTSNLLLFCLCSGRRFVTDETKRAILDGLRTTGPQFVTISDLCGMAVKKGRELKEMADRANKIAVMACYPRAVKWLFSMAGIEWNEEKMGVINTRKDDVNNILDKIREWSSADQNKGNEIIIESDNDQWDPWFPVIDYDRCENCKQCMSFCLFGVYATGGSNKVEVKNPRNCKNNCPACARICPKAAIIFPKYTEPPIDGAEINDEESVREKIKINVNELLGNDIYAALAERRKKAKKFLIKKTDMEQAELERKKFSE